MKFQFKKNFGQHFLCNKNIINKIVSSVPSKYANQNIYEIGPGNGALTHLLLKRFAKITAIEIDKDCVKILEEKFSDAENFEILNMDVLNFTFPPNSCIIGNLPYNIGTKIIENLVYNPIACGIFMLQKEVAQRMLGTDFGRLSVFIQARYKITKIIDVKKEDFTPKPKVLSQVIKLEKHEDFADVDLQKLKDITRIIFHSPRKKLSWLKKNHEEIAAALEKENIDLNLRPENIPKETLYNICK